MSPDVSKTELIIALREAVKLKAEYAGRLKLRERSFRAIYDTPEAWIAHLRETGHLPRRSRGRK